MGDGMTDIENITTLSVADAVRFVSRAFVQLGFLRPMQLRLLQLWLPQKLMDKKAMGYRG